MRRWLRQLPGLELLVFDPSFGRGIGVLRLANHATRFSPRSVTGSVLDEFWFYRQPNA
jgi:hypothetical protein